MSTLDSSQDFYSQFSRLLANNLSVEDVTYAHAYDVFDLLNVGSIHNKSVSSVLETPQLDQLRYYADASEFAQNYNLTQLDCSISGITLAGGTLR